MANVFVSYRRFDAEAARSLAQRLRSWGFAVFIDEHIRAGEVWDKAIENELEAADAVVVLWSPASIESDYVRNEARYALERNKLCPVMIANCKVPVGFQHVQWLDLSSSKHADDIAKNWNKLRETIKHLVDRNGPEVDGIQITLRRTFWPIEEPIWSMAFFANDTELLLGYQADFYGIQLASMRAYQAINSQGGRPILALSGDRSWLLQSSSSGQETLMRAHDLTTQGETRSYEAPVTANALAYRGDKTASAVEEEVIVQEASTGNVVSILKGHTAEVTCLAFSNDDRFIVSSALDGTVRQWHVDSGTCWRTFTDGKAGVVWVGLRSNGKQMFTASEDGFVRTWDVETGELLNKSRAHDEQIVEAALLLDGQFVIGCYKSGNVVIFRTADGKQTASFDVKEYPTAVAVTEDCGLVAVAGGFGTVKLLELRFGADIDEARRPARFWA